jgi:hypothetical protein
MSPLFLKFFRNETKCLCCHSHKMQGYSVCPKHLRQAKFKWRFWSEERRKKGLCCWCSRKSYRGWLRCKKHTSYNRTICREWMARHKGRSLQEWQKRKSLYPDQGKCPLCRQHRKLTKGFRNCWTCRKRHQLMEKGFQTPTTITQQDLTRLCKETRTQLR